ncbi:Y-family DNA polymerase [Microvirga guangxiensis]|uniref:DNA-directed DNA polymerase n=1 Tax=Microvirga guangxiensis TaxID=549386 RepID=A0A1G5L8Y0_9HYPH|nr:type VI secretion protein ImpB [Microvirga guangxiensis]SCZ09044.1 DNA polymerase-4 [Microvirga guangxiensis]
MRKPAGLERLYVDFDSFFASAEQHLQPHLRGKPMGVIPVASEHTGLIAVSREAKALGIKRGATVRDVRRQLPNFIFVNARHERYVELHRTIVEVIESIVPIKAVCSIDEVVCALLPSEQAEGLALGRRVKDAIATRIGPTLTCSVGLGPNDLLAKIAAEANKPDGLAAIRPEDLPGPLLSLELTDIPGIARGNAARLARAGVTDMATLLRLQPKEMRRLWGSVEGERMWMGLHGYTVERPETQRRMFGHGRVLPADWRHLGGAYAAARVLLVKASRRMRRAGFSARALALWLTDRNSAGWYGEDRFSPTWDDPSLLASLSRLFLHAEREDMRRSRSVHVALYDLVPLRDIEEDLFGYTAEAQTKRRMEYLSVIADRLNTHHGQTLKGHALLHWGPSVEIPGGYAGAKIAFNRIPDAEDF